MRALRYTSLVLALFVRVAAAVSFVQENFFHSSWSMKHLTSLRTIKRNSLRQSSLNKKESGSSDFCKSVIAISGSPDYRRLQENGTDYEGYYPDEDFECEIFNGDTVPIRGSKKQIKQLRELLNEGTLVSAETTIVVSDTNIALSGDNGVYLPPGDIVLKPGKTGNSRRKLANYEGKQSVLVVRVTDAGGLVIPDDAKTISDKLFGTYGDTVNMKDQFSACSYGKFQLTNQYSVDISKHLAAPGVINVNIPISLTNSDRAQVRQAAITGVEDKLGIGLPG